jgi:vancomycin resistance protein YoaR
MLSTGGLLLLLGGAAALFMLLLNAPPAQVRLAGYATSLRERTPGQRHNARLAALALDNRVVPPHGVFSFNHAVKSWSVDEGYVKAPVSYDGDLIRSYGGGVCQTSTTLYNAALLAGLPILERHPHVFRPRYIAPGRDAAVAYPGIDLRFKNPYRWPLRIHARAECDTLKVEIWGTRQPAGSVEVATEVLATTAPVRLTRVLRRRNSAPESERRRVYRHSPGEAGFRVTTYRIFTSYGQAVRRERLSDDSYASMNRIVALEAAGANAEE